MDQILVWKAKHADYYYDASTPEKLDKAARKIIHSLVYEEQYIYEPDDDISEHTLRPIDMDFVNMTDEAVAALPEKFQEEVKTHKKRYALVVKQIEDEKAHYQRAKDFADGKVWEEPFRRQVKGREDSWEKILAKWPENPVRDGIMYAPASAWAFLQERNGGEYEHFSLESVEGDDDE
jgi:hypothetical protein